MSKPDEKMIPIPSLSKAAVLLLAEITDKASVPGAHAKALAELYQTAQEAKAKAEGCA